MSLEIVSKLVLSSLDGHIGSNPKIVCIFPQYQYNEANIWSSKEDEEKEILSKCLPFGATENKFYEYKTSSNTIISYIFEIEHEHERNDLVSIGFQLHIRTDINKIKQIAKNFILFLKENAILNYEILQSNMQHLCKAINKNQPLKIIHNKKEYIFNYNKKNEHIIDARYIDIL